jgi:hypothetical protein
MLFPHVAVGGIGILAELMAVLCKQYGIKLFSYN